MILFESYSSLSVYRHLFLSHLLVEALSFAMLNPVITVSFRFGEQLPFQLYRITPHQSDRIPNQSKFNLMVQRRFGGKGRRMIDLEQHRFQSVSDEYV